MSVTPLHDDRSHDEQGEFERLRRNYISAQTMLSELSARFVTLSEELKAAQDELSTIRPGSIAAAAQVQRLEEEVHKLKAKLEKEQQRKIVAVPTPVLAPPAAVPNSSAELQTLRNENARLREELRQKDELIARIVASPSFKIGKRITNTVKKLPLVPRKG